MLIFHERTTELLRGERLSMAQELLPHINRGVSSTERSPVRVPKDVPSNAPKPFSGANWRRARAPVWGRPFPSRSHEPRKLMPERRINEPTPWYDDLNEFLSHYAGMAEFALKAIGRGPAIAHQSERARDLI